MLLVLHADFHHLQKLHSTPPPRCSKSLEKFLSHDKTKSGTRSPNSGTHEDPRRDTYVGVELVVLGRQDDLSEILAYPRYPREVDAVVVNPQQLVNHSLVRPLTRVGKEKGK